MLAGLGGLRLGVEVLQLDEVVVALDGRGLVLCEELLRTIRELAGQAVVTRLVHQELLVTALRLLGVERELLARLGSRVVAVEVPVTASLVLHFLP